MHAREWLNNNASIVLIGSVALLMACLGLIVLQLTGSTPPPSYRLMFDPATQTLALPQDAPDAAVYPVFYGCGSCAELEALARPGATLGELEATGAKLIYVERVSDLGVLEVAFVDQGAVGEFIQPEPPQGQAWEAELDRRRAALCPQGDWVESRPYAP
ncbi:MAG: hypothetical protein AAF612_09160 [Planctomycetota bacterium]